MDYPFRIEEWSAWFWNVISGNGSSVLASWVIAILHFVFFLCLGSCWKRYDSSPVMTVFMQPDSAPAVSTKYLQVTSCMSFFLSRKLRGTHFEQTFLLRRFVVIVGLCPSFIRNLMLIRCSISRGLTGQWIAHKTYAYERTTQYNLAWAYWTVKLTLVFLHRPVAELYSCCVLYSIPVRLRFCYTSQAWARKVSVFQSLQTLWGPLRILFKV
jgi:hypothetical protein